MASLDLQDWRRTRALDQERSTYESRFLLFNNLGNQFYITWSHQWMPAGQSTPEIRPYQQMKLIGGGSGGHKKDACPASNEMPEHTTPLIHRMRHQQSILALAVSRQFIYGGTQLGEILKWHFETFGLAGEIRAHMRTILCLSLSEDEEMLLSSAGDGLVNVWSSGSLHRLYSIRSTYDVGDVFSVVYSSRLQTIFLGAQNTSIQWCPLKERHSEPGQPSSPRRARRAHRFFDSRAQDSTERARVNCMWDRPAVDGGQTLEVDPEHTVQYAHYGYVYCMLLTGKLSQGIPDEDILISGGGDGTIKLWTLDEAEGEAEDSKVVISQLACLENGDYSVVSMALDGTLLYAGLLEGDINVWDLETRQLVRNVKAHSEDVLTLAIAGEFILSGAASGTVKVLNRRNECVRSWKAHDGLVLASALLSHQNQLLYITGGNDDCVAVWDVGNCIETSTGGSPTSNDQLLESLSQLVSFRTVSSDGRCVEDCHRGAAYLRSLFKRFGADTKMFKTPGKLSPVVYARFTHTPSLSKDTRRILFYGHYDVIPADNSQGGWTTDPFRIEGINGFLYGRGVSDNKGPILAALYAAAELAATQSLTADVIFLLEGDEECGSRGFMEAVEENKHIIGDIDWILLANSYWLNDDVPCLTYGFRGVIHATVKVNSDLADLHSGVNGSASMDEPLKDLVMLLSTLNGTKGAINIPGFYEPILPLTKSEERRYTEITSVLVKQDDAPGEASNLAQSLMCRWREPSLTIHRFKVSGSDNASVIPHSAEAAISIRLVPNQATRVICDALIRFLQDKFQEMQSRNRLSVNIGHLAEPWLGDPDNELFRTLEGAIIEVWRGHREKEESEPPTAVNSELRLTGGLLGPVRAPNGPEKRAESPFLKQGVGESHGRAGPLYIREGGSISAVRFLEKTFNAPAANLACGQASDNAHLDQERLRLVNLYKSRDIFMKVFQ